MWFVVAVVALVLAMALVALRRRSRRRRGPTFSELSREDQTQEMRNRESHGTHLGSREGVKHHGSEFFSDRWGAGPG